MRFLQISWTLSKFTIFYKLTPYRGDNFGKRLKLAFENLGLTFVKIGQILSMRYDLLFREDCESLQQLLDNVNPINYQTIADVIGKEYGRPLEQVFKNFDPLPLGSASVSQVHKAETFGGSIVAVKIKRPKVDIKFRQDIKIMRYLARVAQIFSPALRNLQITALVNYFESWILQDLDFVREVKNMKRVKAQYQFAETNFRADLGKGVFPKPFEALCTKNIIVMDYIDGIPLSRTRELLNNPNYDVKKSVKSYVNAAMRNWFTSGRDSYIFQADPHLSNILALPHGDAASIDYGLISELSKAEGELCRSLVIAVYLKDINKVTKIACQMTGVDYANYAPLLKPDLEIYLQKTQNEGFGFWFLEFVKIMVKHRLKFPLFLTTFGRTNVILDGLIKTYMPEMTTLDVVGEELRRCALREAWQNILDADWFKVGYIVSEKIREAPDIVGEFITNPLSIISQISHAVKNTI